VVLRYHHQHHQVPCVLAHPRRQVPCPDSP
jgi:hypothetical protein